ncbi:MAG: Fic family protein [Desulfobacterales bacterium]|nr:Fic family protein [Desulfobacterales bacterium]
MYDHPSQMNPLLPTGAHELADLAVDVIRRSAMLGGRLHPVSRKSVTAVLRIMNSYYSNLIEGHKTHPADIERAMKNEYSNEPAKRALQIESQIHIELQEAIEAKLEDKKLCVSSPEFIQSIHRRFYERLPTEFRTVRNEDTGEEHEVIPGRLRQHEVQVGKHIAPAYRALPAFLKRFGEAYDIDKIHGDKKIIAVAASHHRLGWIHPFSDGNGRVMRLLTDAFMHRIPIHGYGLWTVSRGLARHRDDYMAALTWGDAPRQGDLNGRGNLSLRGLTRFCRFFLETCLDQIDFMDSLLQLDGLLDRLRGYVELRRQKLIPNKKPLKSEAAYLLEEALLRGQFLRGEASRITGLPERTARLVLGELVKDDLLSSDTPKSAVYLAIPAHVASYWFPNLFPES